ncbi:MAG: RNA-protein complex protein Nop10 [Ignisphaera sp.]
MRWRIRKCPICKRYTLKEMCMYCNAKTVLPHPLQFSPEDRYVAYRIFSKYPHLVNTASKKSPPQSSES